MQKNLIAQLIIASCALSNLASAQASPLDSLTWLAGCWQAEQAEAGTVEHWLPLAGNTMLGVARTVKKGKTVAHEFMQIRLNADDKLVFIALPSGQSETSFTLANKNDHSVVFENPSHDFPQRVSYQLIAPNKLLARIEGSSKGKLKAIDFPMQKVACESQ
jgi:hypothetical protein